MAIEKRNGVDFDTTLGGAVLHHKDPERVEGGIKAAETRKENERKAEREGRVESSTHGV